MYLYIINTLNTFKANSKLMKCTVLPLSFSLNIPVGAGYHLFNYIPLPMKR